MGSSAANVALGVLAFQASRYISNKIGSGGKDSSDRMKLLDVGAVFLIHLKESKFMDDAKSTTDDGLNIDQIKKAAAVRTGDTASVTSKRKADDTLDAAADEAKKAEAFDHGEKDAGTK